MTLNQQLADEGMGFLTRKDREMHPRAQVQKLRRIAVRAMSDADWCEGIPSKQHPRPPKRMDFSPQQDAHIARQRHRVAAAIEAMRRLGREHNLGYER